MDPEREQASRPLHAALLGDHLLDAIPQLRRYARSLRRNIEDADELVLETLARAIASIDSFQPGSNLMAWLSTILRNIFYEEYRKRRRETEDADGREAAKLQFRPSQEGRIYFLEVRDALYRMRPEQREALMLIVSGASYENTAMLCGTSIGTVKSRIHRARAILTNLLNEHRPEKGGSDDDPVPSVSSTNPADGETIVFTGSFEKKALV